MSEFKQVFTESLHGRLNAIAVIMPEILLALLVFATFLVVAFLVRRLFRQTITRKLEDKLLGNFLASLAFWIVTISGVSICLKIVGLGGIARGIAAGAGVTAFIIGFAFKDIGENFLAGIMMAFSRPFGIGDAVEINGVRGKVESLNLRNTHVKTPDGKDVYIPNGSVVKNNVFNFTIDGFMRHEFTIGLDRDDDYLSGIEIIKRELSKVQGVLQDRKQSTVMITDTDKNSVLITAFFWVDTFDKVTPVSEIKTLTLGNSIKALKAEGFYLPNSIIEVKNYKDRILEREHASRS